MAPFPGKRKRVQILEHDVDKQHKRSEKSNSVKTATTTTKKHTAKPQLQDSGAVIPSITIQIITGDYDKVTHGLAMKVPLDPLRKGTTNAPNIAFTETFLLAAHTASIRCVAISPKAENNKRFLATGSADERINVYSISTVAPGNNTNEDSTAPGPTLNGTVIAENANNKSLGSLMHHDRAISRLQFPTKGKLFSSAEDNTVAISRTRDWTMLSSIKAPIPKVQGRPSGDTAAPGEVPTGINDFAIHPSQKLMLSVSRGEKCLRLWNLMTGKKAGVLNFDRELLMQVGEGKHSSGEGRRVLWDEAGQHYIVAFERGAVLFGVDSKPRAVCRPSPPTKLHQLSTVPALGKTEDAELLAVSTEDGRILIYDIEEQDADSVADPAKLPSLKYVAELGGKVAGVSSRIKDFTVLPIAEASVWLAIAASSDGSIWIWSFRSMELTTPAADTSARQIGTLLATHKSQSRIMCLAAFQMDNIATD